MNKTSKTASLSALPSKMTQAEPEAPTAPTSRLANLDALDSLPGASATAPAFMEEFYELVGTEWKCRGVIPRAAGQITDCENCGGSGFYAHGETDHPIQLQCRFCGGCGKTERRICWEGKLEYDLTEPLTVQRCFQDYVIKASVKKPARVRAILLPLTMEK